MGFARNSSDDVVQSSAFGQTFQMQRDCCGGWIFGQEPERVRGTDVDRVPSPTATDTPEPELFELKTYRKVYTRALRDHADAARRNLSGIGDERRRQGSRLVDKTRGIGTK